MSSPPIDDLELQRDRTRPPRLFCVFWLLATVGFGWLVLRGQHAFESQMTLPVLLVLLACTLALLRWLPCPVRDEPCDTPPTKRGWFVLVLVVTVMALFSLSTLIGPPLLFLLPALALAVMMYLKPKIPRREVAYALGLGFIAGLAGLGAGWVSIPPLVWAPLQVLLVSTGLLCGWSVLRKTALWQEGIGRSRFLREGGGSALRGLAEGVLIGMPWALSIVVLGGSSSETWVRSWWQPLAAINPGVAEEAWGRILPVPLLFLLLRRVGRPRTAFLAAVMIIGYWFAYLHTLGGSSVLVSTLMIGTLYVLPVSFICLHRDLETAFGFHFWLDFVKFAFAYLLNTGLWVR